jgi:hypothetical protein
MRQSRVETMCSTCGVLRSGAEWFEGVSDEVAHVRRATNDVGRLKIDSLDPKSSS